MIVVDSSVLIDLIRQRPSAAVEALWRVEPREVIIGDIVLLEVLQGARDDVHARRIQRDLSVLKNAPMLNDILAEAAARHYRHLRRLGITTRKTVDLIIATYCIENDHALLHRDRDFAPFERHLGLRTVGLKN